MKRNIYSVSAIALVIFVIMSIFNSCSNQNNQKNQNNYFDTYVDDSEYDSSFQSQTTDVETIVESHGERIIKDIENSFDYAKPEEERFEYSYVRYKVDNDKDSKAVLYFSLAMANVSGKAIMVKDCSKYIPSLKIVSRDDGVCLDCELKSQSREFNRYEYVQGESESVSLSIVETSIWMNREAIVFSFLSDVPETILNGNFDIVVEYRNEKIVVANSSNIELDYQYAQDIGDNIDIYFMKPFPMGDQGSIRLLVVNREKYAVIYKYLYSVEMSYDEDQKMVVRQLDYWTPADGGRALRQNEASQEEYWYFEQSVSPLKTGLYTVNVKFKDKILCHFQYYVIDQVTRNQIINGTTHD